MDREYPIDGIRGVLESVKENADITKPLPTTFDGIIPNCEVGLIKEIQSRLIEVGYAVGDSEPYGEVDNSDLLIECKRTMLLTINTVCEEYDRMNETLAPYGGYCDGFSVDL